jgi:hypothetical protein
VQRGRIAAEFSPNGLVNLPEPLERLHGREFLHRPNLAEQIVQEFATLRIGRGVTPFVSNELPEQLDHSFRVGPVYEGHSDEVTGPRSLAPSVDTSEAELASTRRSSPLSVLVCLGEFRILGDFEHQILQALGGHAVLGEDL